VYRKASEKAVDASQKALIQELMKKNTEATKRYEQLRTTIISAALNSFQLNSSDNFKPPQHNLTGDTTIGATDDELVSSASKFPPKISEEPPCACGSNHLEGQIVTHLDLSELKAREDRIFCMMKTIQHNSQTTRGGNIGLGLSALETCKQIDEITTGILICLEEIMVLQAESFAKQHNPIVPQDIEEPVQYTKVSATETHIETGNQEITAAIHAARRRRRWNVFSIFSRISHRQSKEEENSQNSTGAPTGTVPQTIAFEILTQPAPPTTYSSKVDESEQKPHTIYVEVAEKTTPVTKSYNPPTTKEDAPPMVQEVDNIVEPFESYNVDNLVSQWTTIKLET
jgi:hypothetical protein